MRVNDVKLEGKVGYVTWRQGGNYQILGMSLNFANRKDKKTGQWENNYISCTMFCDSAAVPEIKDGDYIHANGYLSQDRWTDKEGKKKESIKFIINQFTNDGQKDRANDMGGF